MFLMQCWLWISILVLESLFNVLFIHRIKNHTILKLSWDGRYSTCIVKSIEVCRTEGHNDLSVLCLCRGDTGSQGYTSITDLIPRSATIL
jgi:hypothetical protein